MDAGGHARKPTGRDRSRVVAAHQQLVHVLASVFVDLLQPALDVVERVEVGDVVHDDDAVSATVVGAADGAEPLLARSVPLRRGGRPRESTKSGLSLSHPSRARDSGTRRHVSFCPLRAKGDAHKGAARTIWSLIVLPSSSIVRIFCSTTAQGVPCERQACFFPQGDWAGQGGRRRCGARNQRRSY